MRRELDRIHMGTFTAPPGPPQRTELPKPARDLLATSIDAAPQSTS